jgi:hypothetical protein
VEGLNVGNGRKRHQIKSMVVVRKQEAMKKDMLFDNAYPNAFEIINFI